jgi:hypothetical protein
MALGGWPTETFVLKGHTVITGEDVVVVDNYYNFVVGRTENGAFAKSLNKGWKTDETKENNNQKRKESKNKRGDLYTQIVGFGEY